jgi:hypothetical protein
MEHTAISHGIVGMVQQSVPATTPDQGACMSIRNLLRRARGRAGPVAVVAVLAVVGLLAAGCSSKSDSPGVATAGGSGDQASATTAPKADREQQALRFTQCMREQGVNMADPTVDADGNVRLRPPMGGDQPSQAKLQKARDACQQYLQGLQQGFMGQDQTQFRDSLLKYAQCMRKNGYDLPDPDFSNQGGSGGGPFGGAIDQGDPVFKKADAVCRSNLPGLFGGGG